MNILALEELLVLQTLNTYTDCCASLSVMN